MAPSGALGLRSRASGLSLSLSLSLSCLRCLLLFSVSVFCFVFCFCLVLSSSCYSLLYFIYFFLFVFNSSLFPLSSSSIYFFASLLFLSHLTLIRSYHNNTGGLLFILLKVVTLHCSSADAVCTSADRSARWPRVHIIFLMHCLRVLLIDWCMHNDAYPYFFMILHPLASSSNHKLPRRAGPCVTMELFPSPPVCPVR